MANSLLGLMAACQKKDRDLAEILLSIIPSITKPRRSSRRLINRKTAISNTAVITPEKAQHATVLEEDLMDDYQDAAAFILATIGTSIFSLQLLQYSIIVGRTQISQVHVCTAIKIPYDSTY